MQSCWLTPESRPTPTQIYLTLTDLLQVFTVCKAEHEESMGDSQESFDVRWNSLKPNNIKTSAKLLEEGKAKPTSPSMNNLIGSLEDMNRSRNSDEDNAHSILLPEQFRQKFEFKLGSQSKELFETDSLNDSMIYSMRRSSSSETEEENWKTKIERGAYTEKVRQKSRSVADLMVLTHIDCSESESETPLPSLDHRVNYKNVRLAPKNNLESMGYVHGSEGNLLSVQDDFQAELKKLQEEHRDSLFFVPDNFSRNITAEQSNNNLSLDENNCVVDPSSERLFKELNSTSEIKPANQVYNVFNVTIDNLSPVHIAKLNEIINLEEPRETSESKLFVPYEVPKLCDIIQNNSFVSILSEDTEGTDLNKESECVIESSVNEIETRGISKNTEIASTNKDCESRGDPDVFESRAFIENAESGGINEDSENGTEYNKYTKTLSINKDNENRYAKEYLGSRMTNEESECKILNKYFETKVINKDFEGRVGEAFNKDCEIEEIMEDTVTENSERGDVKEDFGNRLINEQFEGRGVNKNCEIRGINEGSENRGVEEDSERKGVSENSENRGEDSEVIISVSDNVRIAEDMIEPSKSSGYEETDLSKNASHFINAPKDDIDIKYLKIELSPNNEEHISLESDLFETENIKLNKSINDSETLNCLVNTGQSTEGVLDISDTKNFDTCNGGSSETLKELNEKIPKNNRDQILGNIINMLNQKSDNNEHFNDKFMEHRIEAILDNIIEIMSLPCQNMSEVCVEEDEKILNDFIEMERKISEIGTDISETYQIQPKSNEIREKLIKIEIESNLDSIVEKEFSEIEDDFVKNKIESNLNVVETKKDENIPEIEDNFHREIKQPILKFGSKVGERSEIRNNKFTKNQIESNAVETIGDSKTDSEIKDLIFQMDDPVLENCFKINSRSEIEANINRIIENNPEIREVPFFQDKIEEPTYDCIKTNENIEISEIRDGESMKCENDLNIKKNSEMEPPVMKNIIQTSSGLSVNRVEDFIKNEIGFYMNSTKIIDGVEDPLIDYNENEPSLNNSEIKYNVQVLNNIYDINRISGSSEIRDELFKNLIDEQTQSVKDNSESKCEIRDSAPLVDETIEIQRITDGFEIRDELMKNEIVELIPIKTKEVIESISVMNGNMKSHKVSDNIEIKEDGRNESNIRDFELIKSQTDGQVINEVAKKKLFDVESENEWKIVPDELGGKYLKEVKESETSELVHNDTKESLANIEDHLSSAELLSEKVEAEDKKNKLLSKNCEVTSEEKSNVSCQNEENLKESLLPICSIKYQVPRLIDLIENNDKLMDYIIANYESELHDDLSCDNSQNINSVQSNNTVVLTTDAKDDSLEQFPVVDFDLSDSQEATNPNSLTHLNAFSSLRIKQKSLDFISSTPNKNSFSSLRDDESDTSGVNEDANLNYSLETWDNFLGTAIDHQNQNINDQTFVFGSLNSEPQSLMFVENCETVTPPNSDMEASMDDQPFFLTENQTINIQEGDDDLNKTYVLELNNKTYELSPSESRLSVENGGNVEQVSGIWEPSGGWFLHPQSSNSVSGQMTEQKDTGSYVKFGMDDEILAALRGELLAKLPHAQGTSSDRMKENEDEWDPSEKEEVFLRYNVYNTPLSPIPEESESEDTDNSDFSIPRR
ncbi:hypothetical protein HHI36_018377 [Cryptolaemus montrouzieri]|uniref:Uncharacterized protein n=1 Tax=Cryptolaemus montrouzieri TaxID=559131 RepID=A0ABD2P0F5_9CUCU